MTTKIIDINHLTYTFDEHLNYSEVNCDELWLSVKPHIKSSLSSRAVSLIMSIGFELRTRILSWLCLWSDALHQNNLPK